MLQATAALFTLVIAHFSFADERITSRKLSGLLLGFLGVVVLAGRSTGAGGAQSDTAGQLLGQASIIGASFCYGLGGGYGRKAMQQRLEPMMVAAGTMTVAAAASGIITLAGPFLADRRPSASASLRRRCSAQPWHLGW